MFLTSPRAEVNLSKSFTNLACSRSCNEQLGSWCVRCLVHLISRTIRHVAACLVNKLSLGLTWCTNSTEVVPYGCVPSSFLPLFLCSFFFTRFPPTASGPTMQVPDEAAPAPAFFCFPKEKRSLPARTWAECWHSASHQKIIIDHKSSNPRPWHFLWKP